MIDTVSQSRSGIQEWHYTLMRGWIHSIVRVEPANSMSLFRDLLEDLKINARTYDKANSLPARLSAGDAARTYKDLITVMACNSTMQFHFEIPNIVHFDYSTVTACVSAWLLLPYSTLSVQSWCMIANYLNNHLIVPMYYGENNDEAPAAVRRRLVSNANRERPSPLLRNLAELNGGIRGVGAWTAFFSHIGSGSATTSREVCIDAPALVTSYRFTKIVSGMANANQVPGTTKKLHLGKYYYVSISDVAPEVEIGDGGNADAGRDLPIVFMQFETAIDDSRKSWGSARLRVLKKIMDRIVQKASVLVDYYANATNVMEVVGHHPLTSFITDVEESRGNEVILKKDSINSLMFTLDYSSIKTEIVNMDYVKEGWGVNAAVNEVGRLIVTGKLVSG